LNPSNFTFSNHVFFDFHSILSQARGLALSAMDMLPPLKQVFARKMMFGVQAW
jgi:hypothetical protein